MIPRYKPVKPPVEWTPTVAEELLDAAGIVLLPRRTFVVFEDIPKDLDGFVEYLALGVALHRAPASVRLRAIYERWDQRRIVRELY